MSHRTETTTGSSLHARRFAGSAVAAALGAGVLVASVAISLVTFSPRATAHGNVTPQAVDVKNLPRLSGEQVKNPYRGSANQQLATEIGASAFNQNCARCHGLEAISGGIAPDLRLLPVGDEGDEYFQMRVRNGATRNGITYMPPFKDVFSEEAIWAIRSYLDSRHEER